MFLYKWANNRSKFIEVFYIEFKIEADSERQPKDYNIQPKKPDIFCSVMLVNLINNMLSETVQIKNIVVSAN